MSAEIKAQWAAVKAFFETDDVHKLDDSDLMSDMVFSDMVFFGLKGNKLRYKSCFEVTSDFADMSILYSDFGLEIKIRLSLDSDRDYYTNKVKVRFDEDVANALQNAIRYAKETARDIKRNISNDIENLNELEESVAFEYDEREVLKNLVEELISAKLSDAASIINKIAAITAGCDDLNLSRLGDAVKTATFHDIAFHAGCLREYLSNEPTNFQGKGCCISRSLCQR